MELKHLVEVPGQKGVGINSATKISTSWVDKMWKKLEYQIQRGVDAMTKSNPSGVRPYLISEGFECLPKGMSFQPPAAEFSDATLVNSRLTRSFKAPRETKYAQNIEKYRKSGREIDLFGPSAN